VLPLTKDLWREARRIWSVKTLVAAFAALTLLFAIAAPAQADVGFVSSSRKAAAPGDRVDLTIGCGFCFPPCVGALGHRHPPGDSNGGCMPRKGRPPASFSVWLTPQKHSLDRYTCDSGEYRGPCQSGSRPPRLPSFIFLGRATPDGVVEKPHDFPSYRLAVDVPDVPPGLYKYVAFCDACYDGPQGSLIDDRTNAAGPLRVLPPIAAASFLSQWPIPRSSAFGALSPLPTPPWNPAARRSTT